MRTITRNQYLALFFAFFLYLGIQAQELSQASPEDVGMSSERLERLSKTFQGYIDEKELPGATLLVARKGKIAYFESFGKNDLQLRRQFFSKKGLRDRNSYTIKSGIAAGFFATSSYALVVWGMQFIEIAYVSSIREISIVIAAIIGLLFLAEKEAKKRIIPSILIVLGISIVYFQL